MFSKKKMTDKTILSIPQGLQVLLRDLEFIGQITRGYKPCFSSRSIVEDTFMGRAYRHWNSEDRIVTMTKIEEIVGRTIDEISNHQNTNFISILINAFAKARNGIETLLTTYQKDPDIRSRINVQLQNIDLQLNEYRNLIKGYMETSQSTKVNSPSTVNNQPSVSVNSPSIDESAKTAIDQEARRHRSRSEKTKNNNNE